MNSETESALEASGVDKYLGEGVPSSTPLKKGAIKRDGLIKRKDK